MTASQFLSLHPDHQRLIYDWQEKNKEAIAALFPGGPPFFLAIKDGEENHRLLYPVLPGGKRIHDG